MSREERKMAQIIASIERMEQEARASGDDAARAQQEPSDWLKQGARGKKGKRGRVLSVKVKTEKKLKAAAVAEAAAGATLASGERKLTPKKRWIQLWIAQLRTKKHVDARSSLKGAEVGQGLEDDGVTAEVPAAARCPTAALDAEAKETLNRKEVPVDELKAAAGREVSGAGEDKSASDRMSVYATESEAQVEPPAASVETGATVEEVDGVAAVADSTSSELRVKTPMNNESSHLSPPLERSSPTVAASISPSAKVKDSDAPSTTTAAAAAAMFSPAAAEVERRVVTEQEEEVALNLERKRSISSSVGEEDDSSSRSEVSGSQFDCGGKRSLEHCESPGSDEAKRRAERRRKRKSNWDVGDPRKGGSPVADLPSSAAAAAANQQSFAKYPPTGPSWRHSPSMMEMKPAPPHFQSMMLDMKPPFLSSHRSATCYNNVPNVGGRRGFYHAPDRSRSAGRSSMRFSYGTSGSNYR